MLPKNRKPVAWTATGSLEVFEDVRNASDLESNASPRILQAERIHRRFKVSWPLASALADLAFNSGRPA